MIRFIAVLLAVTLYTTLVFNTGFLTGKAYMEEESLENLVFLIDVRPYKCSVKEIE